MRVGCIEVVSSCEKIARGRFGFTVRLHWSCSWLQWGCSWFKGTSQTYPYVVERVFSRPEAVRAGAYQQTGSRGRWWWVRAPVCDSGSGLQTGSSDRSFSWQSTLLELWWMRVSSVCRVARGSVARRVASQRTVRRVRHCEEFPKFFFSLSGVPRTHSFP